jgi:segregation and condensation protein A
MYTIRLPNFEGPLDLLLFFIRRDELNIYDIPIAKITSDFLDYTRLIQLFDLELAGDFLVMASTLIQIKTLMLLPRETINPETGEEEDPRALLIERLLMYKQFKDASLDLAVRADDKKYYFYRTYFEGEQHHLSYNDSLKNATLFDLLRAVKRAIDKAPLPPKQHIVERQAITVDEKITYITTLLRSKKNIRFMDLVENLSKIHIVVTFLALLDLVKGQLIWLRQENIDDELIISERMEAEVVIQ